MPGVAILHAAMNQVELGVVQTARQETLDQGIASFPNEKDISKPASLQGSRAAPLSGHTEKLITPIECYYILHKNP